jgi:hypothetical protein
MATLKRFQGFVLPTSDRGRSIVLRQAEGLYRGIALVDNSSERRRKVAGKSIPPKDIGQVFFSDYA